MYKKVHCIMCKKFVLLVYCVVVPSALYGFYYDPMQEALKKNQPERVLAFIESRGAVSEEMKKRYLDYTQRMVAHIRKGLENSLSMKEGVECLKGIALASCGVVSLVMAHLIYKAHSDLEQGRVSLGVGLGGSVLTALGVWHCYKALMKHNRYLEYGKALALQVLVGEMPTLEKVDRASVP
jgi:hypothetical protein